MARKPIIILDLDETLINSEDAKKFDKKANKDRMKLFNWQKMDRDFYVFERPGLQPFLDFVFQHFEVSVWTAASKDYALWIISNVLRAGTEQRPIRHIFFDYHCKASEEMGRGKKDLRVLSEKFNLAEYDMSDTIIIDDNEDVFKTQPKNCIMAKEFHFKRNDSEWDDGLQYITVLLEMIIEESTGKSKQ